MEAKNDNMLLLEDFGVMTEEFTDDIPTYNLKAAYEYCEKVGKRPAELSDLERERLRTN